MAAAHSGLVTCAESGFYFGQDWSALYVGISPGERQDARYVGVSPGERLK